MYFLVLEFCGGGFTFYAKFRYIVTSQLKVVAQTGVPVETTDLPQVTGDFLTCHGRNENLGNSERQLAFSGNA